LLEVAKDVAHRVEDVLVHDAVLAGATRDLNTVDIEMTLPLVNSLVTAVEASPPWHAYSPGT